MKSTFVSEFTTPIAAVLAFSRRSSLDIEPERSMMRITSFGPLAPITYLRSRVVVAAN